LLVLAYNLRMKLAGKRFGRFFCSDADGFAVGHVDECGGDFSPVAEFQSALAQSASGDHAYGVGGAAVDLDEGYEALAVFAVGIVDPEFLQTQHGQTNAEHLAGTEMAVGLFGIAEVFVEGFHKKAVSFQLNTAWEAAAFKTAAFKTMRGGLLSPPAYSILRDFDQDARFS